MTVVLAVLAAAALGAVGPQIVRHLPEPPAPAPDKVTYAELGRRRFLAPGLALAAAVMGGIAAGQIDHGQLVPAWVVIAGVGSWLAFIDWEIKLLPFVIVAPTYVVTLGLVALGALLLDDLAVLSRAIVVNVIVYVVFRLLHWIAGRFFGGAFGYGDVRLAAVLGLALGSLGVDEVIVGIYSGFVLGALVGLLLSRGKIIGAQSYAFGPYLIVGAVIGAAFGPALYGS